jgi:putative transposase
MPYDYRKLSPKEREDNVKYRREHGYPLHAPPHPHRDAGYFLISAANYEHASIMETPSRRNEFEKRMIGVLKQIEAELFAWIILPNHYHFLVNINSMNSLSVAIKHLHGATSRQWNLEDGLTGKRRVWYRFYDRMMRNETQLNQAFNYIHYNPLKHGLIEDVYSWQWSSLYLI